MRNLRKIAGSVAVLATLPVAWAQATPPNQATTTAGTPTSKDKKPVPAKADADETKTTPKLAVPIVDWGFTDWELKGNRRKLLQYATPPEGFFLRQLYWEPETNDLRYGAIFNVQTPGQEDYRLAGEVHANYGATILEATNFRDRFFQTTDFLVGNSERQISQALFKQKLGRDFVASIGAKMDQQDNLYPAPQDPLHQRTRTWNGLVQGKIGKQGFVSASVTNFHYFDRTQVEPNMNATQASIGYLQQFRPTISAYGNYSHTLIEQDSEKNSNVQQIGFGGAWDITPDTDLIVKWRTQHIDVPNVANDYDRNRIHTDISLDQHFSGWTAQLGYSELDLQRVSADQTHIDTPSYHTLSGKLTGKISPWLRFTARGYRESLQGDATMDTSDPAALYWRNIDNYDLKLDGFANSVDGYAILSQKDENNSQRGTDVHNKVFTIGGSWQSRPDLTIYAETTSNWWSANSLDPQAAQLGLYFPNASDLVFGANWNVNPTLTATASYSEIWSDNANPPQLADGNYTGRFITVGGNVRAKNGNVYGITFAPWRYTDRVDNLRDYTTALVTFTARFQF